MLWFSNILWIRYTHICFRIFLKALETISSEESKNLDFSKSKTYFVPTDEAFRRMGEIKLKRIMSDTVYLNKVSLKYVISKIVKLSIDTIVNLNDYKRR